MALTIALDGYGEVANTSGGAATTNWGVVGSGGINADTGGDSKLTGSYAVSINASGNKEAWLYYDIGTADRALDFSGGGTEEGQYLYIWFNIASIGAADTLATEGVSVRIGTSTSVYRTYSLGGRDFFGNKYTGGWQCAVINPTLAGSVVDIGTYDSSNINVIGLYYGGNSTSRADNLFIDSIQCAKGLVVTGVETTTGEGWQEVIDYCTDFSFRAWGVVQEREGIAYVYGNITVGGTVATTFTNSGKVIKYGNYTYWTGTGTTFQSSISDGFHGLTITDNGTAVTQFADGVEVGTAGAGRSGSTYIGSDNSNTTFSLRGTTASSYTSFYNTSFTGITGGISGSTDWGDSANDEVYSCTFSGCGQVSPNGSVPIRNCFFTETSSTAGSLLWTANIDIEDSSFIANTAGAAVQISTDHGADGQETFTDLSFSGNTFDVNNTTGASLDVNLTGTSNPSTSTGSTVNYIANATLTIENIVDTSEVRIVDRDTDPDTILAGVETVGTSPVGVDGVTVSADPNNAGRFVVEYSYSQSLAPINSRIVVMNLDYIHFSQNLTLPTTGQSLFVSQRLDRNFINP